MLGDEFKGYVFKIMGGQDKQVRVCVFLGFKNSVEQGLRAAFRQEGFMWPCCSTCAAAAAGNN